MRGGGGGSIRYGGSYAIWELPDLSTFCTTLLCMNERKVKTKILLIADASGSVDCQVSVLYDKCYGKEVINSRELFPLFLTSTCSHEINIVIF